MAEVVRYTSAPESYDWGFATSEPTPWEEVKTGAIIRKVTFQDEDHAIWQCGRYSSGLYLNFGPELLDYWIEMGLIRRRS